MDPEPFEIGNHKIAPGSRRTVELPVSVLSDHTPVTLSVHVVHGRQPGSTLFVSAAIHGDEIVGVEIIRRLLKTSHMENVSGTLIVVPIVNTFGFMNRTRYLPDRRDLNRSFPGSSGGSLAARLANLFFVEIVSRSDVGIDLHTAAIHRTNLPQIRIARGSIETFRLANSFGAPLVLFSKMRDGSLREAAAAAGVQILLYEAGEGLRFDELAIRTGVTGILRAMNHIGMLPSDDIEPPNVDPICSSSSTWVRAPAGGLLRTFKTIGEQVAACDLLGIVSDPFGETESEVMAGEPGLLIGRTNLPIVNEGDALFHLARVSRGDDAEAIIGQLTDQLDTDPIFDEDEII